MDIPNRPATLAASAILITDMNAPEKNADDQSRIASLVYPTHGVERHCHNSALVL
jgi:hypothetical protein